jgi:hypothetical protein
VNIAKIANSRSWRRRDRVVGIVSGRRAMGLGVRCFRAMDAFFVGRVVSG